MTPAELHAIAGRAPERTALLFDFDGTLAPIVEDPAAALPVDGAVDLLVRLAGRYHRVAVVSGRPRSFLAPLIPDAVDLSALYGLEGRIGGADTDHDGAARWRSVIDAAVADDALPDDVVVEPKGVSLTVHFRQAPEIESDVVAWAERVAADTGLLARPAKASVELHPPLGVDKGSVVRLLVEGCDTVVFVGDDLGDLPAFAVLDELRHEGVRTVKIASAGTGMPVEVAQAADLVVDGPTDVVALFSPLG